jgi:hypothetical protein
MSQGVSAIASQVPPLTGSENYKDWARKVSSVLMGIDLWSIANGTSLRPLRPPPTPNGTLPPILDALQVLMDQWDSANTCAMGLICLSLVPHVFDQVERLQNPDANDIWDFLRLQYAAISLATIFEWYQMAINWKITSYKSPSQAIDSLEALFRRLVSNGFDIVRPERAMLLLNATPIDWRKNVYPLALIGGTATTLTWDSTKQHILCHWNALQVQQVGRKPSHTTHKISAVHKKGSHPSFLGQAAPPQGSKPKKGQTKRGACGKGLKKRQGAHPTHFASTASVAGLSTHTIAQIGPQGLLQRIAVEEQDQSSYGNGPYPSFNEAMMLTDCLEVPKTSTTVQRLEHMVLKRRRTLDDVDSSMVSLTPVPPSLEPSPCPQVPPDLYDNGEPTQAPPGFPYIPSPLPPYKASTPEVEDSVSLFGSEAYDNFLGYDGPHTAADWDDMCGVELYVHFELYCYPAINSFAAATCERAGLSASDHVLLSKVSCNCPMASCTKCRGIEPRIAPNRWMLDSGASVHFSPVFSDFISFVPFGKPIELNTAVPTNDLTVWGIGAVLLKHTIVQKGKNPNKPVVEIKFL